MEIEFIAQLVGFAGLLFVVLSMQPKYRKNILLLQLFGSVLFTIHFGLIGAATGMALNAIASMRAVILSRYHIKTGKKWPIFVIGILFIAATVVSWQGYISLLPLAAMLIATVAFWQRDEQSIRKLILIAAPMWLVYNAMNASFAGVLTEVLVITSTLIGLWRFRRAKSHEATTYEPRNLA